MGATPLKPESINENDSSPSSSPPGARPAECPVGMNNKSLRENLQVPSTGAAGCPVKHSPAQVSTRSTEEAADSAKRESQDEGESRCPLKHSGRITKYLHPHKYDVYGRRIEDCGRADSSSESIDSSNQMPSNPNQKPTPGQRRPLSTERVESTIPKGGTDTTWTYPSPQMFWNALARKGKIGDTEEENMDIVVAIHNNMNENTWKEVLKWEKIRSDVPVEVDGAEPRLLRFMGRPSDTSPKAIAKMMFGHPLPFDRHDWVVDRGGVERRYVIDYYHDEGLSDKDEKPRLHSEGAVQSIKSNVQMKASPE